MVRWTSIDLYFEEAQKKITRDVADRCPAKQRPGIVPGRLGNCWGGLGGNKGRRWLWSGGREGIAQKQPCFLRVQVQLFGHFRGFATRPRVVPSAMILRVNGQRVASFLGLPFGDKGTFAGVVPDERLEEVWFPVECQYLFQPFSLAGSTRQEVLLAWFYQNQLVDALGRGRVRRQEPAAWLLIYPRFACG